MSVVGCITTVAADYLPFEQPVLNVDGIAPIMAAPAVPAVRLRMPSQLMSLLTAQQVVMVEGGREIVFTDLQLLAYCKEATRVNHVPSSVFTTEAPRSTAAQPDLMQTLDTVCRYVGTYNQPHRSQEERTGCCG